jgi:putative acetyltransferase
MPRRLALADMHEAARVLRTSFGQALPTLTGLHTPEEDRAFFRGHLFAAFEMWGAFADGAMTGLIAFGEGWIEQL